MIENRHIITTEQAETMMHYLNEFDKLKVSNKRVEFYYTALTPHDVYVKYTYSNLLEDNSILSTYEIKCIDRLGDVRDCMEQFKSIQEQMKFQEDFIEIILDEKNLKIVKMKDYVV